jgi:ubiquinone/menaquinone biosynthesis C-methylase UbiE
MLCEEERMFTESAQYYDLIYTSFKDYEHEARLVKKLIEGHCPRCTAILDVACGTGEHDRYLKDSFDVDGLDLNSQFVEIAREKNPSGTYYCENMMAFELNKRYDVIMSLFSSIGYLMTIENVTKALACFAKHLKDDGIIIVEPWLTPDAWNAGKLHMVTVDREDLKICRMNISERKGDISHFTLHYLIGTEQGVTHLTEYHEAGLFTVEEMKEAFKEARLDVDYDPEGIFKRGLYIARKMP